MHEILLELMLAGRYSHLLCGQGTVEAILSLQPVRGHYTLALGRTRKAVRKLQ